jgi:hypothetical protein
MSSPTNWTTVERPGYFGAEREAKHQEYDRHYGSGNWRLAWSIDDKAFTRAQMEMFYEDAYFFFLLEYPAVLEELLIEASDVYDDAPTNIASGFDYAAQETNRTHVQDIAIRRAVSRLGRVFRGAEPIQIRDALGEHPLSITLSPGSVPFHRPNLLVQPELEGWWQAGSVESFYQSNKILQKRT